MRELVEGPLQPEARDEREREQERVRRDVAAGVVADEQHRSAIGDVLEAADVGPEGARQHAAPEGQRAPDELRVASAKDLGAFGHTAAATPACAAATRAIGTRNGEQLT